MAERRSAMLDKTHGFMKFIIKNQIDRNDYDQEQKFKKYFRESSGKMDEENSIKYGFKVTSDEIISSTNKTTTFTAKTDKFTLPAVPPPPPRNSDTYCVSSQNITRVTDCLMFNLEFLTKTGNAVNVPVHNGDTADEVVSKVTGQYPLNIDKQDALRRRVKEEMKKYRSHGN